jgi:hypothetical protein
MFFIVMAIWLIAVLATPVIAYAAVALRRSAMR